MGLKKVKITHIPDNSLHPHSSPLHCGTSPLHLVQSEGIWQISKFSDELPPFPLTPCSIVSAPSSYPLPPTPRYFTFPNPPLPDPTLDLWRFRNLRAIKHPYVPTSLSHTTFYRPYLLPYTSEFVPFLTIGSKHIFEYHPSSKAFPLFQVVFTIDPVFQFRSTQVIQTPHFRFPCPVFHLLYWDCPLILPTSFYNLLHLLKYKLGIDFSIPLSELKEFIHHFFTIITPYDHSVHEPLLTTIPPPIISNLFPNPPDQ